MKRRSSLRRNLVLLLILIVVAALAAVSRVDERPYQSWDAYKETVAALDAAAAKLTFARGPMMAGFGKATLTPTLTGASDDWHTGTFPSIPLAGDSARFGGGASGVHDPLWVKTIAVRVGGKTVVLVSPDILMISRDVSDILTADLPSLGLDRTGLYLGATHTHSSVGGWGSHWTDAITAGFHRTGVNRWIARQIEEAVKAAIADLKPATLAEGWVDIPELVGNRTDNSAPKHPGFPMVRFEQTGGRTALLGSYAAHPVILPAENRELSGDYPGVWQRAMEARGVDMAMFMAGPVGGQTIARRGDDFAEVERVGTALADKIDAALPTLTEVSDPVLADIGVEMTMPDLQIRLSDTWRIRPWLAHLVLPFRPQVFVQAIRIGNTVFFSTPCDYAGELALPLEAKLDGEGLRAAVTSFNGEYIGYVMPAKYDHKPGYETRLLSIYGPGFGDFAADVLDREAAALTPADGANP